MPRESHVSRESHVISMDLSFEKFNVVPSPRGNMRYPAKFLSIHVTPISPTPTPHNHHQPSIHLSVPLFTMSPQPKTASPTVAKTPIVTKMGKLDRSNSKNEGGAGMLFTMIDDDSEINTYISTDPIFDTVIGYQASPTFLTREMVEHIKSRILEAYEADGEDGSRISGFTHPLSEQETRELLHEFSACMKECTGGEEIHASFTFLTCV